MVNYDKWDKLDLGSDDDEPRTRARPLIVSVEKKPKGTRGLFTKGEYVVKGLERR